MKKNYQEDNPLIKEIKLREMIQILYSKKLFIFFFTASVSLLMFLNLINTAPIYKTSTLFTLPNEESIFIINKYGFITETSSSIFSNFLANLSSKTNQLKVLSDSNLMPETDNMSKDAIQRDALNFISTLRISPPDISQLERDLGILSTEYYSVSIEGPNPQLITKYLNSLMDFSNLEAINQYSNILKNKINNRLKIISTKRESLINKEKMERLSLIARLNERDSELLSEINLKIQSARNKVKEERLNNIARLSESAKLAKEMGVTENNFFQYQTDLQPVSLGFTIEPPEWYLYGEKALLQRIEMLTSRLNDDPFNVALVGLISRLYEIQNNIQLQTLLNRKDDSPFIVGKIDLDIEETELQSVKIDLSDFTAIKYSSPALIPSIPINQNKLKTLIVTFLGSLLASILLVLAHNAVKPSEDAILQSK